MNKKYLNFFKFTNLLCYDFTFKPTCIDINEWNIFTLSDFYNS